MSSIFSVKKFHRFLYGHKFLFITDHKPLVTILGPKGSHPWQQLDCSGGLCCLHTTMTLDTSLTGSHGNAEGLSHLPLPSRDSSPGTHTVAAFSIEPFQSHVRISSKLPDEIPP